MKYLILVLSLSGLLHGHGGPQWQIYKFDMSVRMILLQAPPFSVAPPYLPLSLFTSSPSFTSLQILVN